MIVQVASPEPFTRRVALGLPLAFLWQAQDQGRGSASAATVERESIAAVERDEGLVPPLTLGIARVILQPGASALAATPAGARMIAVESGVLAVAVTPQAKQPFTSAELAASGPAPIPGEELFVPAGTTIAFGSLGVASVRNPGARSVVALDVVVYHEEPRPIARAFTTDDGISFQLLASASAASAPTGRTVVAIERLRLGVRAELPAGLRRGLTLSYIEAGSLELRPMAGEVFAARAAASAPYSMPGALQPLPNGVARGATAGGVVFLPVGAECGVANVAERPAEILTLTVREVA